jgi:radical SAM PhpK family P-methyltransferase
MTDCLIVGMNSLEFPFYLDMVRAMGTQGGAYRDLNLSFIEVDKRPYQALELLSRYHAENGGKRDRPFHNADFVWPTITYLGSFLKRHGLSFDWINAFQYEKEAFKDKLENDDVLLVAITTTLYVVPWPIQEIIRFVRQHSPKARIVVGGPYISNSVKGVTRGDAEAHFDALGADYYVMSSEGEQALVNLIQAIKANDNLSKVNNIAYREGDRWAFTPSVTEKNELEQNLVDYSLFGQPALGQFVSTRTAKSCPFACSFCNFPEQAGAYTYTGIEVIEKELDAIRDVGGVTTVTFIDDTFNVPKGRFKEMLRMMIRKKYPFKWNCNFRCDHADDEIISMMGQAGCEGVFLGVESGSPKMLKRMNKTAKREDYLWAIPRLKEEGILAHANLFIGFPGETMETVQETMSLIRETKPETYSVQPWYANPMTPIFRQKDTLQIHGSSFQWSHETMDAATACDLVDHVFLTTDDSLFLPQYGFFQWSLFYLRALGMPLERIKNYLRYFNTLVRDKMEGGKDPAVRSRLLASLRSAAKFEGQTEEAPRALEIYSGERREAADAFCRSTLLENGTAPSIRTLQDGLSPETGEWSRWAGTIETPSIDMDRGLAAWSLLMWRLNGLESVPALMGTDSASNPIAPFLVRPRPDATFEELCRETASVRSAAIEHAFHGMDLLTHPPKFSPLYRSRPAFATAYAFGPNTSLDPLLAAPAFAAQGKIAVVLRPRQGRIEVEMAQKSTPAVLARIAEHFEALLLEIAERPNALVADLGRSSSGSEPTQASTTGIRSEVFAF